MTQAAATTARRSVKEHICVVAAATKPDQVIREILDQWFRFDNWETSGGELIP